MDYRRLIPNMCTSSNLVFGMCSILSTYSGNLVWGSIYILLALAADGLEGRTARFFGVASEMGKEMDSLCDLGSFGIAPAFLAWAFVLHNHGILGIVVAIFFAICGMWRLARFNVNASVVHGYFMGLAIPAGGNIVAMTTLLFVQLGIDPMTFGIAYPIVMAFVGWLMVSHVHSSCSSPSSGSATHRFSRLSLSPSSPRMRSLASSILCWQVLQRKADCFCSHILLTSSWCQCRS